MTSSDGTAVLKVVTYELFAGLIYHGLIAPQVSHNHTSLIGLLSPTYISDLIAPQASLSQKPLQVYRLLRTSVISLRAVSAPSEKLVPGTLLLMVQGMTQMGMHMAGYCFRARLIW